MRVSIYNSEHYLNLTAYEAMRNVLREEAKKKSIARERRRLGLPFMPKVFICSPYAGDTKANTERAKRYCQFAVDNNYIPFAPHLFFPRFLDESSSFERILGIIMGKVFLDDCSEVWVFGGVISAGMEAEIKRAKWKNYRLRYFNENCEEVKG